MISLIKGTIEGIGKEYIVLMTDGGVGYEIKISKLKNQMSKGDSITLHTYLKVSDQAMELYGFQSVEERTFFQLLLSVSGVGPKAAMRVLSLGSLDEIQSAIVRGDVKYLTAVQGMGKKTAERLVVELRSKIRNQKSEIRNGIDSDMFSDVFEALVGMGYAKEEVKRVVQALDGKNKTTEEVLRLALKQLAQ